MLACSLRFSPMGCWWFVDLLIVCRDVRVLYVDLLPREWLLVWFYVNCILITELIIGWYLCGFDDCVSISRLSICWCPIDLLIPRQLYWLSVDLLRLSVDLLIVCRPPLKGYLLVFRPIYPYPVNIPVVCPEPNWTYRASSALMTVAVPWQMSILFYYMFIRKYHAGANNIRMPNRSRAPFPVYLLIGRRYAHTDCT